jgi:methylase of polypeptide subunit release factors
MHVRSGVFIPRWETEEWTIALASRLRRLSPSRRSFTLVDLCTGSGCIPLFLKDYISANIDKQLYSEYGRPNTAARFIGIEKSATAIDVARINLKKTFPSLSKFPDSY